MAVFNMKIKYITVIWNTVRDIFIIRTKSSPGVGSIKYSITAAIKKKIEPTNIILKALIIWSYSRNNLDRMTSGSVFFIVEAIKKKITTIISLTMKSIASKIKKILSIHLSSYPDRHSCSILLLIYCSMLYILLYSTYWKITWEISIHFKKHGILTGFTGFTGY
ncbi:MAG: hypothetical protein C5S45_09100 [Candidatus Methanocomedens sp.]|nr:MAG: hypothetical protein C5S45_09100 [ANME-2 cluster archaeon]